MEFMNRMSAQTNYKTLSELEEGREYEIVDYDLKFVESFGKSILNVTINIDGERCSVGLPDRSRKNFEAEDQNDRDQIIGLKFQYKKNVVIGKDGKELTYYNVKLST